MQRFLRLLSGRQQVKIEELIFLFLLLTSYFLLLNPPANVFAAETPKVAIFPAQPDPADPRTSSWFIFNLKAGQAKEASVTVQNKGAQTVKLDLYAVDGSANLDGAFTLGEKGKKEDVGGWVRLPQENLILEPQTKVSLPFVITVPPLATPGDHVGGLAIEEANLNSRLTGSGLKVVQRVGVRLYVNVAGEKIESLIIKSLKSETRREGTFLIYTFVNEGNVNLDLKGQAQFKSILGDSTMELGWLGQVLAGKQISGKTKIESLKPLSYLAYLNVNYAPDKTVSRFTPLKTGQFAFLGLVVLILFLLIALVKKNRRPR